MHNALKKAVFDKISIYLMKENDTRGLVEQEGWANSVTHAADMFITSILHPHFELAPKALLFSEGNNIMDKHFDVMEKKQGVVIDAEIPMIEGAKSIEQEISQSLVDTFITLQQVK